MAPVSARPPPARASADPRVSDLIIYDPVYPLKVTYDAVSISRSGTSRPRDVVIWSGRQPDQISAVRYYEAPRRTAPVRRAASATAASLAALASSAVSVRSGARNRSV